MEGQCGEPFAEIASESRECISIPVPTTSSLSSTGTVTSSLRRVLGVVALSFAFLCPKCNKSVLYSFKGNDALPVKSEFLGLSQLPRQEHGTFQGVLVCWSGLETGKRH